jgi:predicted metal-dependent peptidase
MSTQPRPIDTQRILDELARTGVDLLLREAFFAHLFSAINKEIVTTGHEVDTLAVGMGSAGTFTLYVNAEFWDTVLTQPEHRLGVVKHEMLHLVFRHLFVREPALDPLLLNIAFDLVVNQYIDRSQLPTDSIFLESFADLGLLEGQTWFYYYQKIEQLRQEKGGAPSGRSAGETLQNIRSDSHGLERHQPWRTLRTRSEMDNAILDTHLDSLLRAAHQRTGASAWGSLPAGVQEAMSAFIFQPQSVVNWRTVLRSFATSARSTRLRNTLRRPSRRFGTTPGIRVSRRQRILVALDTSGSVGQAEFQLFFNELRYLWRAGALIDVVECDTQIQRRYAYRGTTPPWVQGRGGTDFSAPIDLANAEQPDALIYFTDGFAATPKSAPRIPVLWVITPSGIAPMQHGWNHLRGRKVKM